MCPPLNELVRIVNGKANIAVQAQPINKKETNKAYWLWIKKVEIKPMPPNIRLSEYCGS